MDDDEGVVEVSKSRCRNVINIIENSILESKLNDSCKRTLLRLSNSELNFLDKINHNHASSSLSVNIGHLEAVIHIIQQPFITGVSRVCKPITISTTSENIRKDSLSKGVHVDIACNLNGIPVWFIVSDRNPKYISWHESGKNKGLKARIDHILAVANSVLALKPSSIVLFFSNGLDISVREKLQEEYGASEFGAEFSLLDFGFVEEVEGDWVNILARSYREACILQIMVDIVSRVDYEVKGTLVTDVVSEIDAEHIRKNLGVAFFSIRSIIKSWSLDVKDDLFAKPEDLSSKGNLINFDTTALIAFVSGISNGATKKLLDFPEKELRQRFKINYEFVIAQVMSEIQSPILMEMGGFISGKRCMVCESVCTEFKELVSMCGGPNENLRAEELLKCLMVVPDNPSDRMMGLPTTRKLAMKNKIVFGTGDYWRAPTLTANMGFVRAVSQTGMSLFTIEHRARSLTGD